jgi:hypothetical protein
MVRCPADASRRRAFAVIEPPGNAGRAAVSRSSIVFGSVFENPDLVKPDEFRDRGVHVARIPEDDLGHHLLEHGPLFRNIMAGARPSAVVSNVHGLVGCREPRRRGSGLQGSPSGGVLCALLLYDAYQRVYASKSPQEYAEAAFDAQQVAHHLGLAPVSV